MGDCENCRRRCVRAGWRETDGRVFCTRVCQSHFYPLAGKQKTKQAKGRDPHSSPLPSPPKESSARKAEERDAAKSIVFALHQVLLDEQNFDETVVRMRMAAQGLGLSDTLGRQLAFQAARLYFVQDPDAPFTTSPDLLEQLAAGSAAFRLAVAAKADVATERREAKNKRERDRRALKRAAEQALRAEELAAELAERQPSEEAQQLLEHAAEAHEAVQRMVMDATPSPEEEEEDESWQWVAAQMEDVIVNGIVEFQTIEFEPDEAKEELEDLLHELTDVMAERTESLPEANAAAVLDGVRNLLRTGPAEEDVVRASVHALLQEYVIDFVVS